MFFIGCIYANFYVGTRLRLQMLNPPLPRATPRAQRASKERMALMDHFLADGIQVNQTTKPCDGTLGIMMKKGNHDDFFGRKIQVSELL